MEMSSFTDLLIDGYNLLFAAGFGQSSFSAGELQRARQRLLTSLLESLDPNVIVRTAVVFDSRRPPPHLPSHWCIKGLRVVYAQPHGDADQMLEEFIAKHSSPRRLTVVSSDHRLHAAARRRRANPIDSEVFWDQISQRRVRMHEPHDHIMLAFALENQVDEETQCKESSVSTEMSYWLKLFGDISVSDLAQSVDSIPLEKTDARRVPLSQNHPDQAHCSGFGHSAGEKKGSKTHNSNLSQNRARRVKSRNQTIASERLAEPDLFSQEWVDELQRWVDTLDT